MAFDFSVAYDDLALDQTYSGADHEYTYPTTTYGTPRQRRSSSVSNARQYSSGYSRSSYYEPFVARTIKFKSRGSLAKGVSLMDAGNGVKLSGGDYVKWHEINADARGRIHLKVAWEGYSPMTYEIPVDGYDNRVRLSSLARRVARAIHHFIKVNNIQYSWDRVKLYELQEVSRGTWQPSLTVR